MAKRDRKRDNGESYEPDVFDNPPSGPAGVHRGNTSLASRLVPFAIVVLVAALCGFTAWGFFSGEVNNITWPWSSHSTTQSAADASSESKSSSSDSTASSDSSDSSKSDSSASKDSSSDSSSKQDSSDQQTSDAQAQQDEAAKQQAAQQQAEVAAQPNKAAEVRVVNGTRTSGYATSRKNTLNAAGYTNVVAANPSGSLPSSTVVWYQSESDKATAENVASTLGISNVQQASGISAAIVVVLMN